MKGTFRIFTATLAAASLGFGALAALPAQAQPGPAHGKDRSRPESHRPGPGGNRQESRPQGQHRPGPQRPDSHRPAAHRPGPPPSMHRPSQRPPQFRPQHRPPPRPAYRPPNRPVIIHHYDYNRPDPRYNGYYANRYYRGGYAPIRVTRHTRIYRGWDNRYYCRRSDGTTGLIVGAALGGLLGDRIDRGQSSILGVVLGASTGALLGREIDRGGVSCR